MSASTTANTCWTSFSNWAMVVSTVDDHPVCFLFVILAMRVSALVLLNSGVLDLCVLDLVLCAGSVVLILGLCLFFIILCLATVDCSTLVTTGVDIVDQCWVDFVIDLVWCDLLLVLVSVTLKLAVVVGVAAICGSWWIDFSASQTSCFISLDPLSLPKFLMALAQYAISAITLSACVMVGRVSFLWLQCTVSVNRSFLVVFIWHLCVR